LDGWNIAQIGTKLTSKEKIHTHKTSERKKLTEDAMSSGTRKGTQPHRYPLKEYITRE